MQTKSFIQKTHDNMFTQPSPQDFNIIKNFVKSEDIKPEDLFVYPIRLCDNCKDRDEERFSDLALNSVKNLCEGVVGIKNHEWNSENAHSRIYKAEVEEIDGIKSVIGYAYTMVTDSTMEFINNIKSGLLQEVSIGFKATSYSTDTDGTKVIDDVSDVFEWSFVAVPAQPKAGVVKEFNNNQDKGVKRMELEARVKELEAEVETKSLRVKELEDAVSEKDAQIETLQKTIVDGAIKSAVNSVKSKFKFKSAKAEEIADTVITDIVEITEDGEVTGCDEAERVITEEYDFLVAEEENETNETKSADEEESEAKGEETDEDEDKIEVKNYAIISDNIIKKSKRIDFTYIPDKK